MTYYRGGLSAFGRIYRGGLGASRDQVLEEAERLRQEIEGRGFSIRYSSGPVFSVTGLPAVAGSNEQLAILNAANAAQRDAWNAQLAALFAEFGVIEQGRATVTVVNNPWGSAGMPVPNGYTINYGNLFQRFQQAMDGQRWAEADQIARDINAITAAGPVREGFVPVIGVTPEGDPVTPGPGIVHTPGGGVVSVLAPVPVTTPEPVPTDGSSSEGGVPNPVAPPPVLLPPPSSSGTTFPGTGPTGPVPDDDTVTGPVAQAGPGGGALALLAVLGIGLMLMRRR